jgi:hypothetical protein
MGKSSPQAPAAPDPYATARAQTGSNVGTAIANSWLGNANEIGPLGTLNYDQSGTHSVSDGQGNNYEVPSFTRTTQLSPNEQLKLEQRQGLDLGLLGLASDQLGQVSGALGQPLGDVGFNAQSYLAANPDVAAARPTYRAAVQGQDAVAANPGSWNAQEYMNANQDVNAAWQNDFNAQSYLDRYSDLSQAYARDGGDMDEWARRHYDTAGRNEGRSAAGQSLEDFALNHYNTYGQNEGRLGLFGATAGSAGVAGDPGQAEVSAEDWALQHWNQAGKMEGRGGSGVQRSIMNVDQHIPQLSEFGEQYLPDLQEYGTQDWTANRQRVEDALYSRLNPQIERDKAALDVQLTNEGFQRGTRAYEDAMDQFTRQANDARMAVTTAGGAEESRLHGMYLDQLNTNNSARQGEFTNRMGVSQNNNAVRQAGFGNQLQAATFANTSREREFQEMLARRQLPLNETAALMSGSQVNMPQFTPYQAGQVAATPLGDYVYRGYEGQNKNYQTQTAAAAQQNAAMFGAGSNLLGGLFKMSDRRVKRDVTLVAQRRDGIGIYRYRYNWDDKWEVGVMADEVERVLPDAVITRGGVKLVDYGALS